MTRSGDRTEETVDRRGAAAVEDGLRVMLSADERLLVVRFAGDETCASWALVNGGVVRAPGVVWRYVTNAELGPQTDAESLLRDALTTAGLPGAVGLLTSRALATYTDCRRAAGGITARCIATVGLSNALRAGDPPSYDEGRRSHGTINLLCRVSRPMRIEAMLEALALAAEARAAAIVAAGVASVATGAPATGTGTDCIVIAAPMAAGEGNDDGDQAVPGVRDDAVEVIRFAGKHTVVGHVVGAAVIGAIAGGIAR